jgi:ATP-binding cassette subfamily B protein
MSLQTNKGGRFWVAYLRPFWPQLIYLFILLCGSLGLDLINPQIIRIFVDTVSSQGPQPVLFLAAGTFCGVILCGQIVAVIEAYMAENVQQRTTSALRADLLQHCLHLDFPFYQTHMPGELIERIEGDISALGNFFSRFVTSLLGNMFLLVGILILFYTLDWRLGLSLTSYTVLAFGAMHVIRGRLQVGSAWLAERQASADLQGFLEESISGAEDLRTNGAIAYNISRFCLYSRKVISTLRRAMIVSALFMQSMGALSLLGATIALGVGVFLFQSRAISIGTVYLIFSYSMLLDRPIQQLNVQLQDWQRVVASVERISALLKIQSAITNKKSKHLPTDKALSCEFVDVSFHYTPGTPVLKHLSFSLQPGQVLGLLGRTGSGKTTITRLLHRFYDPSSGTIWLGDADIRDLDVAELQQNTGLVTQDIHIFHATVRDNITLFDPCVPDEQIIQALDEVGMGDWYRSLPDGLETHLSSAEGLSVGEKQLLAFARVFLKNPRLVILDEASSYLDPLTERRLGQAINRLLVGRTAILIAHRLTTLERADVLLILEDGQCREFGERKLLLDDQSSRYSQLLHVNMEGVL